MKDLRFNVVDEAVHMLDSDAEPWSIELELRVAGSLDEPRFRRAVGEALALHPMARARKLPSRPSQRHLFWHIPDAPDVDPVAVVDCRDDAALQAMRAELLSRRVPLVESPPLRVRLVRHPGGDVVMLNVHHAASDGYGGLRILRSIGRAYAGSADPLPDLDLARARDLEGALSAPDVDRLAPRLRDLADKARDQLSPPARIAADQAEDRPGYGFHHLALDPDTTRAIEEIDHPGTVNDVLVAALHLAIADWNGEHAVACRRIGVMVPVNLRPSEWRQEVVGNFILPTRVTTTGQDRASPRRALDAVNAQSRRIKEAGTAAALIEVLGPASSLPLWAKRTTSPLLALTGNRLVDTAILSNLGELDDPPSFGPDAGETTELWFSAPARMPLGLSVGVATVGDRLFLSLRYRHPQFGPGAARRFAGLYQAALERLCDAPAAVTARQAPG